jgi:spore maturation protein CgeB
MMLVTGGAAFGIEPQLVTWGPILNLLYNLSKVGVNFHTPEQKLGMDKRADLNHRVFDLAAAGCLQVCDNSHVLQHYFAPDEVIGIDDPKDWADAAVEYCRNFENTAQIREKARARVLREHTWDHRAATLLERIQYHLAREEHVRARISPSPFRSVRRLVGRGVRRFVRGSR